MKKFVKMLSESRYQEQLIIGLIVAVLVITAFNAYLDFNNIVHERIVKVVSLGFMLFAFILVRWKFQDMDQSHMFTSLIQQRCLPSRQATDVLSGVMKGITEGEWYLQQVVLGFILLKTTADGFINFSL